MNSISISLVSRSIFPYCLNAARPGAFRIKAGFQLLFFLAQLLNGGVDAFSLALVVGFHTAVLALTYLAVLPVLIDRLLIAGYLRKLLFLLLYCVQQPLGLRLCCLVRG